MNQRTIRTLSHCFWDCKYHCVWTPRYRGAILNNDFLKKELTRILKLVCKWKGWEVVELNIQDDHLHLVLLLPPKFSVSYAMSVVKGKTSAWLRKQQKLDKLCDRKGSLWARGYFVSTIGLDEELIRRYVRHQSHEHQIDQPKLFD